MGFFDAIGTVLERVVPTAIGFATGGPIGAATSFAGVERAKELKKISKGLILCINKIPDFHKVLMACRRQQRHLDPVPFSAI